MCHFIHKCHQNTKHSYPKNRCALFNWCRCIVHVYEKLFTLQLRFYVLVLFFSLSVVALFYHFTISFLPYEAIGLVVQTICLLFLFLSSVVLMPSEIVIFVCHSTKSFSFVWFYMSSIWSLFVSCCQSYTVFCLPISHCF